MSELERIRAHFRAEVEKKEEFRRERQARGRLGEIIVEAWLRRLGLEVQPLPQDIGTKHLLLPEGGKRPDFAVAFDAADTEDGVFFVDAKLHATDNLQEFSLGPEEIEHFRSAMRQLTVNVLFIALVPRERVDRLYLIGLDEIAESNDFGTAGSFRLDHTDGQWLIDRISRPDYDAAVARLRQEGCVDEIPPYPVT